MCSLLLCRGERPSLRRSHIRCGDTSLRLRMSGKPTKEETPLDHKLRRRHTCWNLHLLQNTRYQPSPPFEPSRPAFLSLRMKVVLRPGDAQGLPGPAGGAVVTAWETSSETCCRW